MNFRLTIKNVICNKELWHQHLCWCLFLPFLLFLHIYIMENKVERTLIIMPNDEFLISCIIMLASIVFAILIAIFVVWFITDTDTVVSIFGFYKKKAKIFIRSPYKFYKYTKPKRKYIHEESFDCVIKKSLLYLHFLCESSKSNVSYECYTKYVSDLCKYIDLHIEKAKLCDHPEQSDNEYREYILMHVRSKVIFCIYLERSHLSVWKDHENEFIHFLYSLKPKSCMPITKKDYLSYYDDEWHKHFKRSSDDFDFVWTLLSIEKSLCGPFSRALIDSLDSNMGSLNNKKAKHIKIQS